MQESLQHGGQFYLKYRHLKYILFRRYKWPRDHWPPRHHRFPGLKFEWVPYSVESLMIITFLIRSSSAYRIFLLRYFHPCKEGSMYYIRKLNRFYNFRSKGTIRRTRSYLFWRSAATCVVYRDIYIMACGLAANLHYNVRTIKPFTPV